MNIQLDILNVSGNQIFKLKNKNSDSDPLNASTNQSSDSDPLNVSGNQSSDLDSLNTSKNKSSDFDSLNELINQSSESDPLNASENKSSDFDYLNKLINQSSDSDSLNTLTNQSSDLHPLNTSKNKSSDFDSLNTSKPLNTSKNQNSDSDPLNASKNESSELKSKIQLLIEKLESYQLKYLKKWNLPNINNIISFSEGRNFFPNNESILKSFQYTNYEKLKVIIIIRGFNYQTDNIGISSSIYSLVTGESITRIFKPIGWGHQGVMVISDALTFESSDYYEESTDDYFHLWLPFWSSFIQEIENKKNKLVFMILGKKSETMVTLFSNSISSIVHEHPSSRNFIKRNVFEECNQILIKQKKKPIDWSFI